MLEKYFTEKQIYAAAFFGGPIPPGLLIYRNFKNIGEDRKALLTLILTFVFTIVLFYSLMQIPEEISDKIPNIVFSSIYAVIIYFVYHYYLANAINERIEEEENKASVWKVVGITVLGLLINLVIIFTMAIMEPAFPGEKFEYGATKHEMYFELGEISSSDLQTVGKTLEDYGYFIGNDAMAVRIEYLADTFLLNLQIQNEYWDNSDLNIELIQLKNALEMRTGKKFRLILIHYELSGKVYKKEI